MREPLDFKIVAETEAEFKAYIDGYNACYAYTMHCLDKYTNAKQWMKRHKDAVNNAEFIPAKLKEWYNNDN